MTEEAAVVWMRLRASDRADDKNAVVYLRAQVRGMARPDLVVGEQYPRGRVRTQAIRRTTNRLVEMGILERGLTPLGRSLIQEIATTDRTGEAP